MVCPQCQTENRLGAIFCRSCGMKLDIESIDFETFEEKTGVKLKEGAKIGKIIAKVVVLVVILGIAAAIALAAMVPEIERSPTKETGRTDSLASFNNKKQYIERSIGRLKTGKFRLKIPFSEGEINSYITSEFEDAEMKKGLIVFDEIDVDLMSGNTVEVRFFGKVKGKKLLLRIKGEVELEGGTLGITPVSASIGRLPIPGMITKQLFKNTIEIPSANQGFLKEFNSIEISDNTFTVILDGKRDIPPRRKSGTRRR